MRWIIGILAGFLLFTPRAGGQAPAITPGTAPADKPLYANTYALLIGIDAYQHVPKLQYAVSDVNALKEVLVARYGFPVANVAVLTDGRATKEGIMAALGALADTRRLTRDDRVLIYFSGHGQTVRLPLGGGETGYLIPCDANIDLNDLQNPAPYVTSCIPMNTVWEALAQCPAKHVLLIADACYSGLFARSRALEALVADRSAQVLAVRPARQVMTGGGKGEKTWEKPEWGHGAFTDTLLDELRARAATPGAVFTAQELYASLFRAVTRLTDGKQTPQLADRDTEGEFLFIVPGASAPAPPTVAPPATPGGTVEAVDTTARLRITSEPPGATVFVDDAEKGVTPCTLSFDLGLDKSKRLEIGLRLAGYKDAVRAVTLERGKLTPVSVTLEKIPVPVTPAPPQPGAARVNPKDGAAMVWVPAGEYLMGSTDADNEADTDEKPQHKVYLDGYWIYKTEVTVAQYRKFCQATGRQMPPEPEWKWQDTHPIVNVTWDDAAAYAQWAGAALPTEAQWEKAARGPDGRLYPWGNDWDGAKCVNSARGNAPGGTKPVGGMPAGASPYGCLDMAGNVWEWCADWYDGSYYKNTPSGNPTGPATGTARVVRGGSWGNTISDFFRAAGRYRPTPEGRNDYLGFRCVVRSPGP